MEAVLSGATRGFRGSWTPVGERSNQVRWLPVRVGPGALSYVVSALIGANQCHRDGTSARRGRVAAGGLCDGCEGFGQGC